MALCMFTCKLQNDRLREEEMKSAFETTHEASKHKPVRRRALLQYEPMRSLPLCIAPMSVRLPLSDSDAPSLRPTGAKACLPELLTFADSGLVHTAKTRNASALPPPYVRRWVHRHLTSLVRASNSSRKEASPVASVPGLFSLRTIRDGRTGYSPGT